MGCLDHYKKNRLCLIRGSFHGKLWLCLTCGRFFFFFFFFFLRCLFAGAPSHPRFLADVFFPQAEGQSWCFVDNSTLVGCKIEGVKLLKDTNNRTGLGRDRGRLSRCHFGEPVCWGDLLVVLFFVCFFFFLMFYWCPLVSLGFAWFPLVSLGFAWLGFPCFRWVNGKRHQQQDRIGHLFVCCYCFFSGEILVWWALKGSKKDHHDLVFQTNRAILCSRDTFPILSRDPNLSRKPPETRGKRIRFLTSTILDRQLRSFLSMHFTPKTDRHSD